MKMHIKNIHSKKPTRSSKRLPVCTPSSKPPKRSKPESTSRAKVAKIELIDDSILLIPDDPPVFDASNLEEMVTDSVETVSDTLPMKDMEVTGLVSCNLCDFDSESNDDLKVHMSIGLHTTENHAAFVCQLCHFAFKDKSVLLKHQNSHHIKEGEAVDTSSNGTNVKPNTDVLIKCCLCNYESSDANDIRKHEITEHRKDTHKGEEIAAEANDDVVYEPNNDVQIDCCFCEYQANDANNMKNHEISHHGMVYCVKCDYSAQEDDIMIDHMKSHTGRILFMCGSCEFEATRQNIIENHQASKHRYIHELKKNPVYKCKKCEKNVDDSFFAKPHTCIVTSKFQCEQCTFTAVTLSELFDHMENDHKNELKRHMSTRMQPTTCIESSNIKCDQCIFVAKDVPILIKHIRTTHMKEPCQYCDHEAEDGEELRAHVFEKHGEMVMLHTMADQINHVSKGFAGFEIFKGELANVLKSIFDQSKYHEAGTILGQEQTDGDGIFPEGKEGFRTKDIRGQTEDSPC